MRPYLVEGLDCSGKKTVAAEAVRSLAANGITARVIVGPLIGGPLGNLDARLTALRRDVPRESTLGRLRRATYVLGPIADGILYRKRGSRIVKISSHYRAWARAMIENDSAMVGAYAFLSRMSVRFSGCALLETAFATRLERHRSDVRAGRTTKVEARRFLGPSEQAFGAWHAALQGLIARWVPDYIVINTTAIAPDVVGKAVADHVMECWAQGK